MPLNRSDAMITRDLLRSADGVFQLRAVDKRQVLGELARRSALELGIAEASILSALTRREDLGSTGMGHGIAIPHARMENISAPFGLFGLLTPPIGFDAMDDSPVDLVFMLLLPGQVPGGQLNALACAARCLRDPARARQLRAARGSVALYDILTAS